MANSISMYYGDYQFSPVPFVSIGKQYDRTEDDVKIDATYNMALRGWLVAIGSGTDAMITKQRDLREALATDGDWFRVMCDSDVIMECFPRPINIRFDEGDHKWMDECPYNIEFEYYNEPVNVGIAGSGEDDAFFPPHIKSAEENWEIEPVSNANYYSFSHASGADTPSYQLRVTHTVSAIGKTLFSDSGTIRQDAWEEARDYVEPLLGYDPNIVLTSGVLNYGTSDWLQHDYIRSQSVNEAAGSFNANESWFVINTGVAWHNHAITESFQIETRAPRDSVRSFATVNGTIQGLETRTYGSDPGDFAISATKYASASGYWETIKDGKRVYPRANVIAQKEGFTLNTDPVMKSEGHNPKEGTITYSYEYDDRPSNCIAGAKTESIIVNDSHPIDIFAQVLVLGRGQGPILQDLSTVTPFVREVQITAIMTGNATCPDTDVASFMSISSPQSDVETILCAFEDNLTGDYGQVFKHADNESWNPKEGYYSRSVGWTATDCDTEPSTSFC